MQIIVGVQLDYDDIARLTRLRNYLKPRARKLYLLVRWMIGEHFKAKHNNGYGWHFAFWFSIPMLRFYIWSWLIRRPIHTLQHRYRLWRGDFVCADCHEWSSGEKHDVGWVNYDGGIGYICTECWDVMNERYYQREIAEYAGG